LDYSGVHVADVSVLKGLPLKNVRCGFKPQRDAPALRGISSLETIDGKPAAEFWKDEDARQAAFGAWADQVGAMPAAEQLRAVAKKLQELNPDFDGAMTPTIVGGVVTRVNFLVDHVTDISPLRALTGLQMVDCAGSEKHSGTLTDLWPLH